MKGRSHKPFVDQRGAAVVMAMLVVAIAASLVTGAFYRQSVTARTLENTAAASQVRWLMVGAIDWVRVILNEDARASSTDHLGEPWTLSLAQTRLNDDERDPAWLSGAIHDAQSRFNLRNVIGEKTTIPAEVAVLERLLVMSDENPLLAERIAQTLQRRFVTRPNAPVIRVLPATIDDVEFAHPQVHEAMKKLRPYITLLPEATPINANTAPAQVLAARLKGVTLAAAQRLIASRTQAAFKDVTDVMARLGGVSSRAQSREIAVGSRYFTLDGSIEFRNARLHQRVLLRREPGRVDVVWKREART